MWNMSHQAIDKNFTRFGLRGRSYYRKCLSRFSNIQSYEMASVISTLLGLGISSRRAHRGMYLVQSLRLDRKRK